MSTATVTPRNRQSVALHLPPPAIAPTQLDHVQTFSPISQGIRTDNKSCLHTLRSNKNINKERRNRILLEVARSRRKRSCNE
ncbi:MAG: hypothetical protein LBH04_01915 [Tannerellaceae bacterium]|nr:hypothetical protein [Tannerellaceae bacterium]